MYGRTLIIIYTIYIHIEVYRDIEIEIVGL